jgi:hypothetical protein
VLFDAACAACEASAHFSATHTMLRHHPVDDGAPAEAEDVWTNAQLTALRASAAATPAGVPNFWRRVARGVPGKTAAQCAARYQHTLAEQQQAVASAKGDAQPAGAKGRRGAAAGRKSKPAAKQKDDGGEEEEEDEKAASKRDGRAGAALQAAVLGKRGRAARELALRAAGREVRWKQREADAGHADDAFDIAMGGATCSSALQASLNAAAAATGAAKLVVPPGVGASAVPAAHGARKDAKAHDAYVEHLLRRARPSAKPAAVVNDGKQPMNPGAAGTISAGGGGGAANVRAVIGAIAAARTAAGVDSGDEDGIGRDEEDSAEEVDEYFSDE